VLERNSTMSTQAPSPRQDAETKAVLGQATSPSSVTITVQSGKIEIVTSDGEVMAVPAAAEKAMETFLAAVGLETRSLVTHHPAFRIAELRQEHPSAYAPWTPDQETDLTSRFLAGEKIADIAVAMGRKPGGIQARLNKLGMGTGSPP